MNLRLENERLQNDLNIKIKNYERMMKSQDIMNWLNEQSQYKHKGKAGIGYTKEDISSQ